MRLCHGKRKTNAFFDGIARENENPKLEMTEFVASGDSVAAFGRYEITLRRNGRRVNVPLGQLFQFREGKVVRYVNLTDTAAYL